MGDWLGGADGVLRRAKKGLPLATGRLIVKLVGIIISIMARPVLNALIPLIATELRTTPPIKKSSEQTRGRFLSCCRLAVVAIVLLVFQRVQAQNNPRTWDRGAGTDVWNTAANWSSDTKPTSTDTAIFSTTGGVPGAGTTITLGANQSILDLSISATNSFTISGSTLTLAGGDVTRSATTGTTTIDSDVTIASAAAWDIAGAMIVNGSIGDSGTQNFTKSGTGTLTLTNANNWAGTTTISNGTLEISGANGKIAPSNVTINSGGTLLLNGTNNDMIVNGAEIILSGGTISLGASMKVAEEKVSTLTLTADSIIDFGTLAGGHTLTFADSSGATWTGGTMLSILNWTTGTDHLNFSKKGGLTATQLAQIKIYSDGGSTFLGNGSLDSNFDVVPVAPVVPEPTAVLVGLSLLSLAGYRERRWLFRCKAARQRTE